MDRQAVAVSEMTAFAQHSTREMRELLLGEVSCHGEKPDDELQRALGVAHEIVGERGRGVEDLALLLARAVVRLSSLRVEEIEQIRQDGVAELQFAAEVVAQAAELSDAREKVRIMMRQNAQIAAKQEQAVELMLVMLDHESDRIRSHPEWIEQLNRLSGAEP